MDRERARAAFDRYAAYYDLENIMIRLKVEHTYRVMEFAKEIAGSLSLSDEACDLAWLLGLLHDIGRFEQYARYGTFVDRKSVDHAELGADILFGGALAATADGSQGGMYGEDASDSLRDATGEMDIDERSFFAEFVNEGFEYSLSSVFGLSGEQQPEALTNGLPSYVALAETAIRQHNKLKIPSDLDEETLLFCKILRDADKVDIFRVLTEPPYDARNRRIEEDVEDVEARQEVMQAIFERRCVPRTFDMTDFESLIACCCMAFELEFDHSRILVREQGYLDSMLNLRMPGEKRRQQLAEVRAQIAKEFSGERGQSA